MLRIYSLSKLVFSYYKVFQQKKITFDMTSQYFYHILCSIGIIVAVILGVVVGIILLIICCCCVCSNACSACCNCGRAMVKRPKTNKSKQDKKKRKPKHRLMPGVEVSTII